MDGSTQDNQDPLRDTAEYEVSTQAAFRSRPEKRPYDSRQRAQAVIEAENRTLELIEQLSKSTGISRTHAAALSFSVLTRYLKKTRKPDTVFLVVQGTVKGYDDPFDAVNAQLNLRDFWYENDEE